MEKRFTLFLILTVAILVIWGKLGPERQAPQKPPAEQETPGAPATPETEPQPQPATPQPERAPAPQVSPEAIERLVLENRRLRLHMSNVGGTVERAELLDYHPSSLAADHELPLALIQPFESRLRSLALTDLNADRSDLDAALWTGTVSPDGRSLRYETELSLGGVIAPMKITKELRLPDADTIYAELRMVFGIPGEAGSGTRMPRKFRLQLTGGVFLEPGGSVMTLPRSVVSVAERGEQELRLVTSHELKKAQRPERLALRGTRRFVADLSNYFGAYLILTDFPDGSTLR